VPQWLYTAPSNASSDPVVTTDGGTVVFGAGTALVGVNATTGSALWSVDVNSTLVSPLVVGPRGDVYVVTLAGLVRGCSVSTRRGPCLAPNALPQMRTCGVAERFPVCAQGSMSVCSSNRPPPPTLSRCR
jgi:outer membrane protein assembly factor BamB